MMKISQAYIILIKNLYLSKGYGAQSLSEFDWFMFSGRTTKKHWRFTWRS